MPTRATATALRLIAIALTVLALPAPASAATPPAILTAGIDAGDQLYATWRLAPGTSYEMISFGTVPTADAQLRAFFAADNFAGFDACDKRACRTRGSYTSSYPIPRDRRYFVKVTAVDGDDHATSAVWVIDESRPIVPGDTGVGSGETKRPATGRPLATVPVPAGTAIALLAPPKTLAALLRDGVRVRVACPIACAVTATIRRVGRYSPSARVDKSYRTRGTRLFTLRLTATARKQLGSLRSARLRIAVTAFLFDGAVRTSSRTVTVRR